MTLTPITNRTANFSSSSRPATAEPLTPPAAPLKGGPDTVELTAGTTKPPHGGTGAAAPKKWTVMVYSCSDNNLYRFMQDDLDEAERVGSNENLNTVVETSHQPIAGTVERLQLMPDQKKGLHSPRLQDLGKKYDMADPKALADFIEFGESKFPAEHYLLVVADHGGGWQGACESESHDSWLTLPKLAQGLKMAQDATGRKLDGLGFDACLMGSTEVIHELAPYASYITGSEEVEGGAGWQYDDATGKLRNGLTADLSHTNRNNRLSLSGVLQAAGSTSRSQATTPRQMAEAIVAMAKGHQQDLGTMTAVDTSKVSELTKALDGFGKAIIKTSVPSTQLSRVADQTQKFEEYYDLSDFAGKIASKFGKKDADLAQAASSVQAAVEGATVSEQHAEKYPNAHGLTIELDKHNSQKRPPHLSDREERVDFGTYAATALAQDTCWNLAINKIRG